MIRASSLSRAGVEAVCSRPYDDELKARGAVQVLETGGWPVELRDRPEEAVRGSGVLVVATVLDHETKEPIGVIAFLGAVDG